MISVDLIMSLFPTASAQGSQSDSILKLWIGTWEYESHFEAFIAAYESS